MRTTQSFYEKDEKSPPSRFAKKQNKKINFKSYMGLDFKGENSLNGVIKRVKNQQSTLVPERKLLSGRVDINSID